MIIAPFLLVACTKSGMIADVVTAVDGHEIVLKKFGEVTLIGVYLPDNDEPNHFPDFYFELQNKLLNQNVEVKIIKERLEPDDKNKTLVEIYLDGENINKWLLGKGRAFFSEDYWNKSEKEIYRELEKQAKTAKLGIWKDINKLKILAVRHKDQRWAYRPGSLKVESIKEQDRVYYYTEIPYYYHGVDKAYFNEYK